MTGKYFDTHRKMVDWPLAVLEIETRKQLWATVERLTQSISS